MSDEKERLVAAFERQLAEAIAANNNDGVLKYGRYLLALGDLDEVAARVDPFTRHLLAPLRRYRREAALGTLFHAAFALDSEERDLVVRVCAECLLELGWPELLARMVKSVVGEMRQRFVVVDRQIGHLFVWED